MDLTTKTIKSFLMTNFLFGLVLLISCSSKSNVTCSKFEQGVEALSINQMNEHEFNLSQILKIEVDSVYIFEGPRFPDEISEIIHLPYNESLSDDDKLYILIKDGNIILSETSFCGDVGVHNLMNSQGYTVLKKDAKFLIKRKEVSDRPYFEVLFSTL